MKKIAFSASRFRYFYILLVLTLGTNCAGDRSKEKIQIFIEKESPQVTFGIDKLRNEAIVSIESNPGSADIIMITGEELCKKYNVISEFSALKAEGFSIKKISGDKTAVISTDQTGAMYGLMDISEQLQLGRKLSNLEEKNINPATEFRGIKFNLPWNSYRTDQSLQMHESTIRDLNYWKEFLDMMAENRFNALTLWNLHPFSYMIRAKNFPEACPFSDSELKEWQDFWHGLFRMASERGIRTYVFNWNIMVSSSFAEKYKLAEYCLDSYPGKNFIGDGDYSPVVQKYMQESLSSAASGISGTYRFRGKSE